MDVLQGVTIALLVIAALGSLLTFLQRKGLVQYGGARRSSTARRMETVERLTLSPQHSLHLVRVDGRLLLIASAPGGCSVAYVEESR
jgi:flagellar biogenesis protein FliO